MFDFLRITLAGAAISLASSAFAAPVMPNVWYEFGFLTQGTSLLTGVGTTPLASPVTVNVGASPWTIGLARAGSLFVTDAFASGDQFEILDFGAPIGMTSLPVQGSLCGNDLSCALADPNFSHASFALTAGLHSFTGAALLSPFGGGAGAFIIRVTAIPVPAAAPLLLTALAALGGVALRRRHGI